MTPIQLQQAAIRQVYAELSDEFAKLTFEMVYKDAKGYEAALWDFKCIAKDRFELELKKVTL